MCFIKVGDPLSPCEHEECKKTLEAFKVQNCLYNNYPLQASGLYNVKRSRPEAQHLHSEISQEVLKRMKFDKDENCYSNGKNFFKKLIYFLLFLKIPRKQRKCKKFYEFILLFPTHANSCTNH